MAPTMGTVGRMTIPKAGEDINSLQLPRCILEGQTHNDELSQQQMQTSVRQYFTPTGMGIIKKTIVSAGKYVEKWESSYIAGRIVKWCRCFGKQSGNSSNG